MYWSKNSQKQPGQEEKLMNLKQALYIRTVAQEGSVTAAAKKLYVSQPSLSQMIRQVESEYGVTLLLKQHAGGIYVI